MARDPREAAAAVAQQTAAEVLGGDDEADERPRSRAAPQAVRNGARRMDPGDAEQMSWLTRAVEQHVTGLPRRYGDVRGLVLYDGETPVAEFDGGGEAAAEVAAFMVLRATLEGKRIALTLCPLARQPDSERITEVTRWRFFARPEAVTSASQADPDRAPSWGGAEALRLRDAHNHQLVQSLVAQNAQTANSMAAVLDAAARAMREVSETVNSTLKGVARTVEALAQRVTTAEESARTARADATDYARELLDAHRALETAVTRAERAEDATDREPVAVAVKEVSRELAGRFADAMGLPQKVNGAQQGAPVNGAQQGAPGGDA